VAIVCYFAGSVQAYQQGQGFAARLVAARPERCPHCGGAHSTIFWGCYLRWVYTTTDRFQVRIERVRCTMCGVTDALLPSFLHMFRRYTLILIQQAITLALEVGVWGQALVDTVGPYHQPAPATLREWVGAFVLSAEAWLLAWLLSTLSTLDPLTALAPDLGSPPAYLPAISHPARRAAFTRGWQALRLAEMLYAAVRARQPTLVFQAEALFAFLAAALGVAGRAPRILWPQATARPP
jgi:hypothetical protein